MDTLLDDIEAYLKARKIPPSTFGRRALNDPAFVSRLRKAGSATALNMKLVTINKVRRWMLEN
jgi:hypothetical protein